MGLVTVGMIQNKRDTTNIKTKKHIKQNKQTKISRLNNVLYQVRAQWGGTKTNKKSKKAKKKQKNTRIHKKHCSVPG